PQSIGDGMGILDRIFKTLWGKSDSEAKKAEPVAHQIPEPPPQSYRTSPEPQSRRESASSFYAERPVEVSLSRSQPQPAPQPEPPSEPHYAEPVAYEPQATDMYGRQEAYPQKMESYEDAGNTADTFEPPELAPDLIPAQAMSMNDLAETIQTSTPMPVPG